MDCRILQEKATAFLEGRLPEAESRALEQHLEDCEACQAFPLIPVELGQLLRRGSDAETAPMALRQRVLEGVGASAGAAPARDAAPKTAVPPPRRGSRWWPRLALAAVLAFLVLVPARLWLRAPALADEAVQRHEHHIETDWSRLTCCKPLDVRPGDRLADPTRGLRVPDLSAEGLELIAAGRCDAVGDEVTGLVYHSSDGQTFSLYITDRGFENFRSLRTRDADGVQEAHHQVRQSEVTIWEQSGLIWFWIGPRSHPEYTKALKDLRRS